MIKKSQPQNAGTHHGERYDATFLVRENPLLV